MCNNPVEALFTLIVVSLQKRPAMHEIMTKHLLFSKLCSKWVPKNLIPEHKSQTHGSSIYFSAAIPRLGKRVPEHDRYGCETWFDNYCKLAPFPGSKFL